MISSENLELGLRVSEKFLSALKPEHPVTSKSDPVLRESEKVHGEKKLKRDTEGQMRETETDETVESRLSCGRFVLPCL